MRLGGFFTEYFTRGPRNDRDAVVGREKIFGNTGI